MPETRKSAKVRAKKVGIPTSQVTKSEKGGYFIAPRGVTQSGAKKAYANCRASGKSKATCAKIAHSAMKRK